MNTLKEKLFRVLKWSEKYTKTDMVYLMSGGFFLSIGHVITAFVSFFVTVIFGYYLSKEANGNYKYILSVFALLSAFTLTGVGTALVQSIARGYDGAFKQSVRLSLKWSIFAVAGALVGASYYFYKDNFFLGTSLILIAMTTPFIHSFSLYTSYINGKQDYLRLSIYSLVNSITPLLLTTITLLFTKNVLLILTVYFSSNLFIILVLFFLTIRYYKPATSEDPELEKYSLKLSILNIINLVTTHIDKVIVFTSLGAVELAVYGFASAFPDQIRFLLKKLNTLMVPKFTESSLKNKDINLRRKTVQLGLLLTVIMLSYVVTAPFLYSVFFPKYPESVYFSRILSLMILSSIAMIPLSLFIAQKKEIKYAKATIGGSLFQIALLIPSAHFWGLTGVAISKVIGSYTIAGISYYLVRKHSENKID
jgi:O-antigen/teichoic acid export membrane protein